MRDLLSVNPQRVQNLFRMDLHHMIYGKVFYVMIGIAIFMPIMMLTQMSDVKDIMVFVGSNGTETAGAFGAGMNLSVLNILTGILLCIYIGREYTTGFIKSVITAHANKYDYIISKGLIALICNIVFTIVYLLTLFILGTIMGLPAGISSILGLMLYILEKLILSIPMSILMVIINLVFRRNYGWSIIFICIAATGIITMSLQMGLQMLGFGTLSYLLNFTISGASFFATTSPNLLSYLIIVGVAATWTLLFSLVGDSLMNKKDVF